MKRALLCGIVASLVSFSSQAQVLLSGGLSYSQNFDSLPSTGTSGTWTDNSVLTGWYASKDNANVPQPYTVFRVDAGGNNSGTLYDYGSASSSDRALGTDSSGTPLTNSIGLLFKNDTGSAATYDISLAYTGEQWRNGGNVTAQNIFTFGYQVFTTDVSGTFVSPIDPAYTGVSSLNFLSPTTGATAAALDGNASANRVALSGTMLAITLNAGDEIMFRWQDINDIGNDHGGAIDDLSVNFTPTAAPEPTVAALGGFAALVMFIKRRNRR